ncbi:MAG: aminomethyl-transferring glycine dehydrogenase, partial [Candidatus Thermoplasmatota archaeon]|nr:aminomethyl-transferring glycine dehydrogenase [Candidatus Thermoplasmatota archaeon]
YIENPNYFGLFEHEISHINTLLKKEHILFVVGIDPLSLGIVNSPGTYGADMVIGEGRALGNPMDFGGSGLGLFACKQEYLRQIPGRIIGRTQDADCHPAYCMTLQTREQHIRRGRATSNICTNEGLNALTALAYLAVLGQNGLYDLSYQNFTRAKKVAQDIWNLPQYDQVFSGIHFNEFVVRCHNMKHTLTALHNHGIHGGIDLSTSYQELKNCLLFGVTETHTKHQINQLISVLKEVK